MAMMRILTEQRTEKFFRKLAGMADLEDALKKLDRLTQEEARMANAEVLRITQSIRNVVEIVDGKVDGVDNKVDGVGDKVEEIGDNVKCVDTKIQVVIDSAQGLFFRLKNPSNIYTFRQPAGNSSGAGNKIGHSTDCQRHRRNQVFVASSPHHCCQLTPELIRREPVNTAPTIVALSS